MVYLPLITTRWQIPMMVLVFLLLQGVWMTLLVTIIQLPTPMIIHVCFHQDVSLVLAKQMEAELLLIMIMMTTVYVISMSLKAVQMKQLVIMMRLQRLIPKMIYVYILMVFVRLVQEK